jgi:ATP-dependent Clp protease ATP-binding subunit ClpB
VVLLDEVEKAHPEVFDVLLQVLDDGRLTDGQGRTVDFRSTILVLTSNLGGQVLLDPAVPDGDRKGLVLDVVRSAFKPEFLNRLDEMILFAPLSASELSRIVDLMVDQLAGRLTDRRLTLQVTAAAREWLAEQGFDPAYGARPLRRLVQREIGDRLATGLLDGSVRDDDLVVIDLAGGPDAAGLVLRAVRADGAAADPVPGGLPGPDRQATLSSGNGGR